MQVRVRLALGAPPNPITPPPPPSPFESFLMRSTSLLSKLTVCAFGIALAPTILSLGICEECIKKVGLPPFFDRLLDLAIPALIDTIEGAFLLQFKLALALYNKYLRVAKRLRHLAEITAAVVYVLSVLSIGIGFSLLSLFLTLFGPAIAFWFYVYHITVVAISFTEQLSRYLLGLLRGNQARVKGRTWAEVDSLIAES